ncbi:MAG: hypothetical protein APR56_07215 [Methanosaeta sp. SDB]|nr:MAG: hypothetical protein APR56_07215 [Methanosaeta sp. SDB]
MNDSRKGYGRVLVVDDDPDIRTVLAIGLSDAGYACEEASNGPDAIEMVKRNGYDVVFMDLLMPGLSGGETISMIKDISPKTAVVVISIVSDEESMRELFESGALVYIRKPFNMEEVVETANSLTRSKVPSP